jgi:predicted RecB family nuclease
VAFKDEARFYKIDGDQYPSVTTIIKCLDKPALVPWASKMQREADALLAMTAATPRAAAELILASGNAAYASSAKAADIGTEAHAAVEWFLKGYPEGERPHLSEPAENCFQSWLKWWEKSGLTPVGIETVVHSSIHEYAGRIDVLAEKKGKKYVIDWKTGKDIYPEAHLQNIAYRAALDEMGMKTYGGAMVLLPKDGGAVKVVQARKDITVDHFLSVYRAWQVLRLMNNQPSGERA